MEGCSHRHPDFLSKSHADGGQLEQCPEILEVELILIRFDLPHKPTLATEPAGVIAAPPFS